MMTAPNGRTRRHAEFYTAPAAPRVGLPDGRAYIEQLGIHPQHVMARLQGWLVPGKWDTAQDCVQHLFIYLWHRGRDLPTDRALAMRILVKWARLRIMSNKSRFARWGREVTTIPHHASAPETDKKLLTRMEALEYLAQAATHYPTAPMWAAAIIGENTLDDMEAAGYATSSSEALRRRNKALRALRAVAGSEATSKRVLVTAAVADEEFKIIAYACERKAKAIASRTGMAVRNVYNRMAKLGIERHGPPRNPVAILKRSHATPDS